jgi:endonuclease YncB( thermonuclease family)
MIRMHHRAFAIITFTLLLMVFLISNAKAATIQIDKTGTVSTVIDGSSFLLNSGETVKLAGIDTTQSDQQGDSGAKNYLTNMVQHKTVYLDIDNIAIPDQYGTLMSVAYIDYNSTHYENVNMAMIVNNYAIPISLNNSEFNPSSWTWFVPKVTPSSSPTFTPTPTASSSETPYSPTPTPTLNPSFLAPTPAASSSETPYSPPSTLTLNPSFLEFLALATLIIISIVGASVIFLKLHKRKG